MRAKFLTQHERIPIVAAAAGEQAIGQQKNGLAGSRMVSLPGCFEGQHADGRRLDPGMRAGDPRPADQRRIVSDVAGSRHSLTGGLQKPSDGSRNVEACCLAVHRRRRGFISPPAQRGRTNRSANPGTWDRSSRQCSPPPLDARRANPTPVGVGFGPLPVVPLPKARAPPARSARLRPVRSDDSRTEAARPGGPEVLRSKPLRLIESELAAVQRVNGNSGHFKDSFMGSLRS